MRRALPSALLVLAAACAPAPTQLVVVVDTDIPIPTGLDEIVVQVTGPAGEAQRETARLEDRRTLPLTLGVAPSGDALGPIELVAMGRRGGDLVTTRTHRVTLVRGETRMLSMHLAAACAAIRCDAGETCGENGCVDVVVDDLPPWSGAPPGIRDDGGVRDAGPTACAVQADCDDDDPCTNDACIDAVCTHVANDVACEDGLFCTGADRCADRVCVPGADPCSGVTTCDEARRACIGCTTDEDCPDPIVGAWGACDFGGSACAEAGTQARSVQTFSCVASACVPRGTTETQACARDTDGASCAARSCPDWSLCGGYDSDCDETGTMNRACTEGVCAGGTCEMRGIAESADCGRDTDGQVCGGGGCDAWSGCSFGDVCTTDGTRTRWCHDEDVCDAGRCRDGGDHEQTGSCSRGSTDGVSCGGTSCGGWGACEGPTFGCDPSGSQSRSCTPRVCGGGTCGDGAPYGESQGCTRDVTGQACDDGNWCTDSDTCDASGFCWGYYWC